MEKSRIGRTQFSLAEAAAIMGVTQGRLNTLVHHGIITPESNKQRTRWLWDQSNLLRAVVALDTIAETGLDTESIQSRLSEPEAQERFSTLTQTQRWKAIVTRAQNLGIALER